jgi:TolA-binding protein
MKKLAIIMVSAIVLISALALSGCEQQSTETKKYIKTLTSIDENMSATLSNMNLNFYNYYVNYDWTSYFVTVAVIPTSIITAMISYEEVMTGDMSDFQNYSYNFSVVKGNINQMSSAERNLVQKIETKMTDYQNENDNVTKGIEAMKTYREFIDLVRLNLILTENFTNKLTIMNSEVSAGQYQEALTDLAEIKNITKESKVNMFARNNLSIVNYTRTCLNSSDLFLDAWNLYEEYLQLFIDGDTSTAAVKFTEYNQKYNEALTAGLSQGLTDINNQIDAWYQDHIMVASTIFENYYTGL